MPRPVQRVGLPAPNAYPWPSSILTYFLPSLPPWITCERKWRLRLPLFGLFRCFLPACLRLSLPLAVTRKRFLEPLWVFILGMLMHQKKGALVFTKGPGGSVIPGPFMEEGGIIQKSAGAWRAK